MKRTLINLAPTMALLAVVVYLCWPYLDTRSQLKIDMGGKQLTRIKAEDISPELPPRTSRNPFAPAESFLAKTKVIPEEMLTTMPVEPARPAVDPLDVVAAFKLSGTFLGPRNCALIDDVLHFEGDDLPPSEDHDFRCTLYEVRHNKVVIRIEGKNLALDYRVAQRPKSVAARSAKSGMPTAPGPTGKSASNRPGDKELSELRAGKSDYNSVMKAMQQAVFKAVQEADRQGAQRTPSPDELPPFNPPN